MVVDESTKETDLLVIGGGPGGYHAPLSAALVSRGLRFVGGGSFCMDRDPARRGATVPSRHAVKRTQSRPPIPPPVSIVLDTPDGGA